MALVLPRYIVVKSKQNNSCLKYVADAGEIQGFLQFNGDESLTSPNTKIAVEIAQTGENTLVHLRSCYSNKYLARKSDYQNWITASAVKKDEDPSSWTCTLFKPEFPDDNYDTVHFKHVQLGLYVYSSTNDAPYTNCLFAGETSSSDITACAVTDSETVPILPRFVAFKGSNGKYLCSADHTVWMFFNGNDISEPKAGYEVSAVDADGKLNIKSRSFNGFWTFVGFGSSHVGGSISTALPPEYLATSGEHAKFQPIKLAKNVIALRSNAEGAWYCYRETENDANQLYCGASEINDATHLEIVELVKSREIYDVNFRLSDSRIYNQTVQTMATAGATNATDEPNEIQLTFSYTDKRSSSWTNTVSMTIGVTMSFQAGIPEIASESIAISQCVWLLYSFAIIFVTEIKLV